MIGRFLFVFFYVSNVFLQPKRFKKTGGQWLRALGLRDFPVFVRMQTMTHSSRSIITCSYKTCSFKQENQLKQNISTHRISARPIWLIHLFSADFSLGSTLARVPRSHFCWQSRWSSAGDTCRWCKCRGFEVQNACWSLAFWILLTCDDIDQQSLRLHIKIHPSLSCRLYSRVGYGRIWTSSCNNWRGTSVPAESLLPESHVEIKLLFVFIGLRPDFWREACESRELSWTHVSQLKTHILWHTLSRFRLILPHLVQYVRKSAPGAASCCVLCVFVRNC